MAGHNILTTESWFCPGFALKGIVLNNSQSVRFVGIEKKNGASVAHFTVFNPAADPSAISDAILQHLSTTEIYLDFQTLRPVAFNFNIHPDDNANLDIPVEIRFADYANVGGMWVPRDIEKYVNSTLALKLSVTSSSQGSPAALSN